MAEIANSADCGKGTRRSPSTNLFPSCCLNSSKNGASGEVCHQGSKRWSDEVAKKKASADGKGQIEDINPLAKKPYECGSEHPQEREEGFYAFKGKAWERAGASPLDRFFHKDNVRR
jgi:hypothetical protein